MAGNNLIRQQAKDIELTLKNSEARVYFFTILALGTKPVGYSPGMSVEKAGKGAQDIIQEAARRLLEFNRNYPGEIAKWDNLTRDHRKIMDAILSGEDLSKVLILVETAKDIGTPGAPEIFIL